MRLPSIEYADRILDGQREMMMLPSGYIVPARPEPSRAIGRRWYAAWLVFTGRADALLWPEQ